MDIPLLNPRALTFLLNNIRKRNSFCAVRRPPFCNINSKMASGRWLAKVLGNYKAAQAGGQNAGIHSRPVHAMLSLIYIALLFPLGRLFSVLCAQCPRFWYCFSGPGNRFGTGMTSVVCTATELNFCLQFKFMTRSIVSTYIGMRLEQ